MQCSDLSEKIEKISCTGMLINHNSGYPVCSGFRFVKSYELQTKLTARRFGLGKVIMEALEAISRSFRMKYLCLTCFLGLDMTHSILQDFASTNTFFIANTGALAFYESLG